MNIYHQKFTDEGYNDWKHAASAIQSHEQSTPHRSALISMLSRQKANNRIDADLQQEVEKDKLYWRKVLERIVEVIRFISERGLAFRGSNETIGSESNGNYLGILELLAKFDPFLNEHLNNYANKGKSVTSYLSHRICDEFIELLATHVENHIVTELKTAKYFSISLDSTPDLSHTDQLTLIIRYVLPTGPVERFVKFLSMEGHTADQMLSSLMQYLNSHNIDIKDCRGQSYDNASNMSGKYNGLQAKVKNLCNYADFVPCFGHSLNLVGTCCAEVCQQAVLYFSFLSGLYTFFSASTSRWSLLMNEINKNNVHPLSLKRMCGTRWAERADAVLASKENYGKIVSVLKKMTQNLELKADVRLQAKGFLSIMSKLETGFMTIFWNKVLQRFQSTSGLLQVSFSGASHMTLECLVWMLEWYSP